jgi:hypothetical protein
MDTFLVVFDQSAREGQSIDLGAESLLKSLVAKKCHVMGSVWAVQASKSADEIHRDLAGQLRRGDTVMVAMISGEWSGGIQTFSKCFG